MEDSKEVPSRRNPLLAFLGLSLLMTGGPALMAGLFSIPLWIATIGTTTPRYDSSTIATWGTFAIQTGGLAVMIGLPLFLKNKGRQSLVALLLATLLLEAAMLGGLFLFALWPLLSSALRIVLTVFAPLSFFASLAAFLGMRRVGS